MSERQLSNLSRACSPPKPWPRSSEQSPCREAEIQLQTGIALQKENLKFEGSDTQQEKVGRQSTHREALQLLNSPSHFPYNLSLWMWPPSQASQLLAPNSASLCFYRWFISWFVWVPTFGISQAGPPKTKPDF